MSWPICRATSLKNPGSITAILIDVAQGFACSGRFRMNIVPLRTDRGLSQEELAYRAGIDRSYLSEIENGQKNLGVMILEAIAGALEVEAVALFRGYRRPSK